MEIRSTMTSAISGSTFDVIYREADPVQDLKGASLQGVHAYCFYDDRLVIVYAESKGYWTPPGGGIEERESFEEAVVREVQEETNMKVLHQEFIGYQDIFEPGRVIRQTRSFCIVEPYGDFISDPDGEITEIKQIEPGEYKKYFDWGEIGDHIFDRVIQCKSRYESKYES
ncbi:MAG: NUDIX hydrolase [Candidatus Paceibacterota bacterium]